MQQEFMTDMCRLALSSSAAIGRKIMLLCMLASYGLTAAMAQAPTAQTAVLNSPSNGSTNLWSPVLFSWTPVANATAYYLYVGSTPGTKDVVDTGEIGTTSITATLVSGTYFARLYTLADGVWSPAQDVTFTVSSSPAAAMLTSPLDGATNVGAAAQFNWAAVPNADGYRLLIGSSVGSSDIFQSNLLTGTSVTVQLADSTKYYVQLQTIFGGHAVSSFSSFTTAVVPAVLLSPANGASQLSATPNFTWNAPGTASAYQLLIGSHTSDSDILNSGILTTNQLSFALPQAGRYYVRLRSNFYGVWYYSDSSFSSGNMATLLYPPDGAINVTTPVPFAWSPAAGAQAYYLYVGNTFRALDMFNGGETQNLSQKVNLAPGKRYYATIWTLISGAWTPFDSTFVTDTGTAQMLYPQNGSTNVPTQAAFAWSAVSDATGYQIDIGSGPGLNDIFTSGPVATNTLSVPNLAPQILYYIRLTTFKPGLSRYAASTFTTGSSGTGISQMIYPADGATNVDVSQPFTWTSVADAQKYYLHVGTAPWLGDVFDSTEITSTSISIPSDHFTSGKYYAFVSTLKGGVWQSVQTSFVVGDRASVVTPKDGATDVDPLAPVAWTGFPEAQAYYLYVGTSVGAKDVYETGETLDLQRIVPGLLPGQPYYLRLHTKVNNSWVYVDSKFIPGTGLARLVQPADDSLNADSAAPFIWNSLPDAQAYYLTIGSTPGARDVYDQGATATTALFVPGLAPAKTYFVRLYTEKANTWKYVDSTFQISTLPSGNAASLASSFLTPADGDTGVDPFATITWTPVSAASYELHIGTTPGAWDIYDSGQTTATSITPSGLGYAKQYYARLWVNQNNQWSSNDIRFQTEAQDLDPNLAQRESSFYDQVRQATANVRLMADLSNMPLPDTMLATYLQSVGRPQAVCSDFAAVLVSQLDQLGVNARLRGLTLTGTSFESHTTVEFYDPFVDKWSMADATFGFLLTDTATGVILSVEELSARANKGQFSLVTPVYLTQYGNYYAAHYYLDPISLYANALSPTTSKVSFGPQPNSAEPFLNDLDLANSSGQPSKYLVKFQNPTDSIIFQNGPTAVTLSPSNGTQWSGAIQLQEGWTVQSNSPGVQLFTFKRFVF
jgi:hypothetical protein